MNIEFGSGGKPFYKHYKQCDIRCLPNIDFCCHALHIKKFISDNSVDNIFSRHFFEHLTFNEGKELLNIWYKILKQEGTIRIILPNISFHIKQWLSRSDAKELNWAKAGFWGWQRHDEDIHKSGYDINTLTTLISNIGFKNIISLKNENHQDIDIIFNK